MTTEFIVNSLTPQVLDTNLAPSTNIRAATTADLAEYGEQILSSIDIDMTAQNSLTPITVVASGVSIGNGIILTAAHNFGDNSTQNYTPFTDLGTLRGPTGVVIPQTQGQFNGVTLSDGFTNLDLEFQRDAASGNIDPASALVGNFGGNSNDLAILQSSRYELASLQEDQSTVIPSVFDTPDNRMVIYSDPNDAQGALTGFGYLELR